MAGLNFQTCTVVNALPDVRVKDFNFSVGTVTGFKRKGADFKAEKVVIDLASAYAKLKETGYGRFEMYVSAYGAEPAVLANALAYKGLPIWVEFSVTAAESTADKVAAKIAKLLESNENLVLGKKMFNVSVSGAVITLEATGEYLRVDYAKVYALSAYTDEIELVATGTVTKGVNGFGTYSHLIKDLRLPTAANTGWAAPNADEMPVVGGIYNQYIVNFEAEAPHTGMQAVGQKLVNTTTHVFWVNKAIDAELNFDVNVLEIAALTNVDGDLGE